MLVQYGKGASLLNEYESPRAVLRAISAAAKRQAKEVGAPVDKIMQMEYRNRLLARVFAPGTEWVLKGGTSTLVRLPDARATKDIDLLRQGAGIEAAVSELQEIAAKDIGDFFRFTLTKTTPTLEGGTQPAREGVVLVFDTFCGKQLNPINVDLVVSPTPWRVKWRPKRRLWPAFCRAFHMEPSGSTHSSTKSLTRQAQWSRSALVDASRADPRT